MIEIKDASHEKTFLSYVDAKNQVKGTIKGISNNLILLQQYQADFGDFLSNNPQYAQYYIDSVKAIEGLESEFDKLETLAADWIATVERIKKVNPLF